MAANADVYGYCSFAFPGQFGNDHTLVLGHGYNEQDIAAPTCLAKPCGLVSRHVDSHDGGDDATVAGSDAVALP